MTFSSIVEDYDGRLTGSDRALISVVLANLDEAVYLTASDLAARAGVHASTVVRLARKLGFDGYSDMRDCMRRDAAANSNLSEKVRRRLDSIEQGSILENLVESEIAAIAAVTKTLSQEQIDKAADILAGSGSIFVVGRGSAVPLVAHFDRRLRRAGFRTDVAINLQKRDFAEKLMNLRKGDAAVIFAFQAPESLPEGYAATINHIAAVGASSIVISDASGPTLRPRADVTLSVSRPDESIMQLRTGPMIVCEALAMNLTMKEPQRTVKSLQALEALRASMCEDGK